MQIINLFNIYFNMQNSLILTNIKILLILELFWLQYSDLILNFDQIFIY